MDQAFIRFYQELNDFLPSENKKKEIPVKIEPGVSVKSLIERLGVPHTEVDLILCNGDSIDFFCKIKNGDRISVYPVFESFDIGTVSKVRPAPLRHIRFILDVHLGKLAKSLRFLGFDTLYSNAYEDSSISEISNKEKRIVLTRDRGLLKRKIVTHGYTIRSKDPEEQLKEVIARFDLSGLMRPLTRCIRCNAVLVPTCKEKISEEIPPLVYEKYDSFHECPVCKKIYWPGTHWDDMKSRLSRIGIT